MPQVMYNVQPRLCMQGLKTTLCQDPKQSFSVMETQKLFRPSPMTTILMPFTNHPINERRHYATNPTVSHPSRGVEAEEVKETCCP